MYRNEIDSLYAFKLSVVSLKQKSQAFTRLMLCYNIRDSTPIRPAPSAGFFNRKKISRINPAYLLSNSQTLASLF